MALEKEGYRVTYMPVDREGLLKVADLEGAITDQTAVVSLTWANNKTGVLFPVERVAGICRSRGVLYYCDAVQAAGKIEIDVQKIPFDYLSLTGHKCHAPKGIAALYVRRKAPFTPYVYGGHQERDRREVTESVPPIAGMEKAGAPQHLEDRKSFCDFLPQAPRHFPRRRSETEPARRTLECATALRNRFCGSSLLERLGGHKW
jgi:cysteine sulfinate desulfinase/cysteine desulfurase-like protein